MGLQFKENNVEGLCLSEMLASTYESTRRQGQSEQCHRQFSMFTPHSLYKNLFMP